MIGVIGVGDMGLPMSGHMVARGFDVVAYDVDKDRLAAAVAGGAKPVSGLAEMANCADIFVACLRTDDQMADVAEELAARGKPGQLIVVAGTHSLDFMRRLAGIVEPTGLRIIDAPVVFGALGAREGNLLSLCGGNAADVDRARPVMLSYSRGVEHVGPLGAGQLAKTCNNLLHWIHCVANYETLAIAKRYGVDAQRMREVLLKCPGDNGTLRRWDSTRFTWQEKDMDFVIELAQSGGLVLPLSGHVDQLIKTLSAADVAALLYGPECSYLGRSIAPLAKADGGL
jgi:3-hydroxyisobutyrate dehydrogenase-like beta-hydroxyacid dehydrogenase